MRFFIYRTSTGSWSDEKPCERAVRGKFTVIDRRTVDDPIKIPAYHGNPEWAHRDWYGKGSNHRVEKGWITRDMETRSGWFISIRSMKQLDDLRKEHGELSLRENPLSDGPAIEIVDDYR